MRAGSWCAIATALTSSPSRGAVGGAALTHGAVRDASPAFSPDGRSLAFLRTFVAEPGGATRSGADAEAQVWILPLGGGEAWQLTRLRYGASALAWSPDGRRLAVVGPAGEHPSPSGRRPMAPRHARGASPVSTTAMTSPGTSGAGRTCGSCAPVPERGRAS